MGQDGLKILISAYACNPYKGSEYGVGWGWINCIATQCDLWVITDKNHEKDIKKEIEKYPDKYSRLQFHYIERKRFNYIEKIWPPSYLWTYRLWQKDAYKLGEKLNLIIKFDIIHLLTYVGYRDPGYLWRLDAPFVWGPIGGLENTPWRFFTALGIYGSMYYTLRNFINSYQKRFFVNPKKAFKKARGGVIAATRSIQKEILKWYNLKSEVICEIGPPEIAVEKYSKRSAGEAIRISWSGSHLPGKALNILLRALAQISNNVNWELNIFGQGPCTKKWIKLAQELGFEKQCTWHGWMEREKTLNIVKNSHIFVITSLKDLTSTVLLEALSLGIPVVCLDHCGFKDVVNNKCGIKIPLKKASDVEEKIAKAIEMLWSNEDYRRQLAEGALMRVRKYSWENKSKKLLKIYHRKIENIENKKKGI